ncbi:hypothetical protein BC831DRAFT_515070 [Entophlyctis helioformis]|nr:hypothetical protein BC831DRAFT_515070 [Entophlyctis helioformis]
MDQPVLRLLLSGLPVPAGDGFTLLDWLPLLVGAAALICVLPLSLFVAVRDDKTRRADGCLPLSQHADGSHDAAEHDDDDNDDDNDHEAVPHADQADADETTPLVSAVHPAPSATWLQAAALAKTRLPATAIQLLARWLAVAVLLDQIAILGLCVGAMASAGEQLTQLFQAGIWTANGLLLVFLTHASQNPRSSAPRSTALLSIAFVASHATAAYSLVAQDKATSDPLYIAHATGLALAVSALFADLLRPANNAAEINRLRIAKRPICREETSSILSRLTFSWVASLLSTGRTKPLEAEDLPHVPRSDQMAQVIARWKRLRNPRNSFYWDLLRLTYQYATFQLITAVVSSTLQFASPFFINRILVLINSQMSLSARHWGMQLRSVLVYEIFTKSLHRADTLGRPKNATKAAAAAGTGAGTAKGKGKGKGGKAAAAKPAAGAADDDDDDIGASQGKIVSLMSSDTSEIRSFMTDIHSLLVDTPLSIILSISGLLYLMGPPALAGLVVIIVSGPISGYALSYLYKVLSQRRTFRDRRIQVTNEALQGIRIIKFLSWEPQFVEKIIKARDVELRSAINLLMSNLLVISISWSSSILVTFISFFFYTVVAGKTLDAATAFTSISLLSTVSFTLSSVSENVTEILNIRVVMTRISSFLGEEELERYRRRATDPASSIFSTNASIGNEDDSDSDDETVGKCGPKSKPVLGFRHAQFTYYSHGAVAAAKQTGNFFTRLFSRRKPAPVAASTTAATAAAATPAASGTVAEADGQGSHTFYLRGVSITFPIDKLTTIIGPTGAGKSSLLSALLGELKRLGGTVFIPFQKRSAIKAGLSKTTIAYAAQRPWLINATIRENILFGEPYDEDRYRRALWACALERDLETFPGGDLTEIGEKGINLSGGQKQRVSLARATYSRATIILLDDPLSAVDAPTARHIFNECILKELRGRTVLLVTHAVGLVVPQSDLVVAVRNGSILGMGSPTEIMEDPEVGALISSEIDTEMSHNQAFGSSAAVTAKPDDADAIGAVGSSSVSGKEPAAPAKKATGKAFTDKEGKATGSIKWKTYQTYLVACGGAGFVITISLSFFVRILADYLSNWWIERWTDNIQHSLADTGLQASASMSAFGVHGGGGVHANMTLIGGVSAASHYDQWSFGASPDLLLQSQPDALYYIIVYGLISLVELFALIFKFTVQFWGGMMASRTMHTKLIQAVLGSPLLFFEKTPVGRIINRFSKDLADIDTTVIFTVTGFFSLVFGAVLRIALVAFVTPPFLFSIGLLYFYYRIAKHYLASSRELKRIESVSSSPIYAQFGETLNGVSTIRAYGAEDRMIKQMEKRLDANHRAYFHLFATNQWLSLRMAVLSATIVFGAGLSILVSGVSAGWAGVAFNFATQFTGMMSAIIQIHSSMEMAMNAVERVEEYSKLEQEPPMIVESYRPPDLWPNEGKVEFQNLSIKYAADLPDALSDLTFTVQPHEKLGIVGRTGAGKSTLSTALFRILPFSSGTIFIDNLNVSRMGLRDLRSRLTIIPQDPLLFEGTLRSNLDPLDEHSDEAIWNALKLTHLLDSLQRPQEGGSASGTSTPGMTPARSGSSGTPLAPAPAAAAAAAALATAAPGNQAITLEARVTENGTNFSQGQRQLLCFARALLRKSRLIFLDEATASVDADTDAKIQDTIRTQFKDATVMTVAHRLRTVVDYDRILVLDQGKVAEIGTPYELLQSNGHFASMCRESGDYEQLTRSAGMPQPAALQEPPLLRGMRFFVHRTLPAPVYERMTALLVQHGGRLVDGLSAAVVDGTEQTDVVVVTALYDEALAAHLRLVTPLWVEKVVQHRRLCGPEFYSPNPALFYSGMVICCDDQIPIGDVHILIAAMEQFGGQWRTQLTSDVTHWVTLSDATTEAVEAAQMGGVKIILPHYFDDCATFRRLCPDDPYLFPDPRLLSRDPEVVIPKTKVDNELTSCDIMPGSLANHRIFFDHAMHKKSADGLTLDDLAQLERHAILAGAKVDRTLNEQTTILIAELQSTQAFKQCFSAGKIIGTPKWLRKAREDIATMIKHLGGQFTRDMSMKNTHLICAMSIGPKYQRAIEWGIAIVNHLWLEDIYMEWKSRTHSVVIFEQQRRSTGAAKPRSSSLAKAAEYLGARQQCGFWCITVAITAADPSSVGNKRGGGNADANDDEPEIQQPTSSSRLLAVPPSMSRKTKAPHMTPRPISSHQFADSSPISRLSFPQIRLVTTGNRLPGPLMSKLKSLGVNVAPGKDFNCVYAKAIKRTEKILLAVTNGFPIVDDRWINACIEANRVIPPIPADSNTHGVDYILQDSTKDASKRIDLLHSIRRARTSKLLDGRTVYVSPCVLIKVPQDPQGNVFLPIQADVLRQLVETAGGQMVLLPLRDSDRDGMWNALEAACKRPQQQAASVVIVYRVLSQLDALTVPKGSQPLILSNEQLLQALLRQELPPVTSLDTLIYK